MAPKHFFISYNHADTSWAEWIAATLSDNGYSVALQAWDFRPGQNFVLEMQRATSEAERTIMVLSPAFLASHFTAAEWAAAFAQDPTGARRKLIPVRVAPCRPEGLLGPIIYIDLVGKEEDTARASLLSGLSDSGRPSRAPRFPGAALSSAPAATSAVFPGGMTDSTTSDPSTPRATVSPSRTSELRSLLKHRLRLDSDLDAFCLDFFPSIKRRFSNGMDRTQKESLLLELADPDELAERLRHVE